MFIPKKARMKIANLELANKALKSTIRGVETRNATLQERITKLFDENEELKRKNKILRDKLYKSQKSA